MAKSIKKPSNADRVTHYKNEFQKVEEASRIFDAHDAKNDGLQYAALQAVFEFGQQIRLEAEVLEAFVREHDGLQWNKVTEKNPYNALIHLAFAGETRKAWRSQCSNVLAYAHDKKINEPLSQWLEDGGVSGRYKEAVDHFARSTTGKAGRSKALRLQTAKAQLVASPLTGSLSGFNLNGAKPGFFRSLVYYDGKTTRLVHVRDTPDDTATETYLLDLVGPADIRTHPLADKPLFRFYRAIDLIVGSCGAPSEKEERHILIWNEEQDDKIVTRLKLVSDAYTFTHTTVTLAEAILELEEKGALLLHYADAQTFRKDFHYNDEWRFEVQSSKVYLANNAQSQTQFQLLPFAERKGERLLRAGANHTRRAKHFRLTMDQMQSLISNTQIARKLFDKQNRDNLTPYPKPKRFQLALDDGQLRVNMQELPNIQTVLLTFKKPLSTIHPHRELAIEDAVQLFEALVIYGDDVAGYFADSDVEDAAFCINHDFLDGDRFEYASPLVISVKMDRTLICDYATLPIALTETPPNGSGPSSGYSKRLLSRWAQREKATHWPETPYKSGKVFGAFITSFLPNEPENRIKRKFDFEWQLQWWRRMTDVPVTAIVSNWNDEEVDGLEELGRLQERGGRVIRVPARPVNENRIHCLSEFYASDFDWGIIMDDDAALSHSLSHNSGAAFFSEMATNGTAAYDGIDVFYPINPGKSNSQGPLWNLAPDLFRDNHVFDPEYDLKGSMFVVRNFRKAGRPDVLPPADFNLHGEDTLFAIEAVSKGCSVMRCGNIVLQEFGVGVSHFSDRINQMKRGNERIAEMYADAGLRMSEKKGREHNLDRAEMLRRVGRSEGRRIIVKKP